MFVVLKAFAWRTNLTETHRFVQFVLLPDFLRFKDRMHCFSMHVVMNKCFILNHEKRFSADPSCCFREKRTL